MCAQSGTHARTNLVTHTWKQVQHSRPTLLVLRRMVGLESAGLAQTTCLSAASCCKFHGAIRAHAQHNIPCRCSSETDPKPQPLQDTHGYHVVAGQGPSSIVAIKLPFTIHSITSRRGRYCSWTRCSLPGVVEGLRVKHNSIVHKHQTLHITSHISCLLNGGHMRSNHVRRAGQTQHTERFMTRVPRVREQLERP